MKKGILILVLSILLISIFSIGIIYSEDAGTTPAAGGTTSTGAGEKIPVGGDTGKADITPYLYPQGTKSSDYSQKVYSSGQVSATRNSDGTSSVKVGSGGSLQFVTKDGKQETASIKDIEGDLKFKDGRVSGFDLKSKTDQRLEIPVGKNNVKYEFDVKAGSESNFKQELDANGNQKPIEVRIGQGDGSTVTVKPPKATNADGTPASSKEQLEVAYKSEGRAIRTYTGASGISNYIEAQPQKEGLSNPARMRFENGIAYGQKGDFIVGNKDGTKPASITGSGEKVYFTGDKIPEGAKPGSYLAIGDKSIEYMNTKKEGMSPVVSFPGMKNEDSKAYTGISAGPESGFKLSESNGLTKIDYTGKLLGQVEIDGKVISSQMVTTVSSNGQSVTERKVFETIGENFAPDGATTRNVEINLGEKSIKMQTDDGKIIETNGKIVATQDGDKVRMAVVGEGESSSKIISELKNHEPVSGEIMDEKSRVVVNPPNPPPETQPPVQPVTHVEPEPPKPPEQPKVSPIVINAISSIRNPDFPKLYHQIGPKALNDFTGVRYTILEFSNPQCGNCIMAAPEVNRIADANPHIKIVPIDANSNPELVQKYLRGPSYPIAVLIDQSTGEIMKNARGQEITASGANNVLALLNYVTAMKK